MSSTASRHWFVYAFVLLPLTYLLFDAERLQSWNLSKLSLEEGLVDFSWAHFSLRRPESQPPPDHVPPLESRDGDHPQLGQAAEEAGSARSVIRTKPLPVLGNDGEVAAAAKGRQISLTPLASVDAGDDDSSATEFEPSEAIGKTETSRSVGPRNPLSFTGLHFDDGPYQHQNRPAESAASRDNYCKLLAQASTYGLIDFSIFDSDYCSKPDPSASANAMIDTNSIDCTRLMEFLYLTRGSTKKQILHEKELLKRDASDPESGYPVVMYVNRVGMFVTAHAHIVGAIISQRDECFSEQVRLLFVVNLRRFKTLVSEQFRIVWLAYQGVDKEGYCMTEKCTKRAATFPEVVENWTTRVTKLLDSDLKTFKSVLETWRPPLPEEAHFYSHETDGRFTTLEMLRRATFNEWFVDTGMLRAALRSGVFPVGSTVADLGAGTGEYARWLNDTGLVDAFSFDGSADIELLTKKKVKHLNLVTSIRRPLKHNWVLLLEICEHIPAELHPIFFQNVGGFAGDGIVLSWAPPQVPNIGHTNPLPEQDVRQVLQKFLPLFSVDQEATQLLRAHSQVGWLKNTLTVLRRYPENLLAGLEPTCYAEEHVMFAGEDDAVLEQTDAPQTCCDACRQNPDCRYWVWSHSQKTCWLKRTKVYQTEEKGFLSGTKDPQAGGNAGDL
ncbi:unnamed protein product [Amoebophrya sp. A120]|nr:unnamed protein product [Amoebophrya sp. A120]|eukprot:GSA120T00018535001.1